MPDGIPDELKERAPRSGRAPEPTLEVDLGVSLEMESVLRAAEGLSRDELLEVVRQLAQMVVSERSGKLWALKRAIRAEFG